MTMPVPPLHDIFRVFSRIGLLSFGGPAAQISLMHRELVEERPWLSEQDFLRALSLCMLLPGPEAMQLATYAGWRLRGTLGGLIAGFLFVIPGACTILALALFYAHFGQMPLVQAAFEGVKAAVIVIVLQALFKVSKKALKSNLAWCLALAAFLALFVFDAPFPLVIVGAATVGLMFHRNGTTAPPAVSDRTSRPFLVMAVFGLLWAFPIVLIAILDHGFLMQIALFFSKLAVVTFGGAYAVLAYMTQTVVSDFGWITTEQMIDALGLAETTPGPLILVTQFVAMLAGFEQGGPMLALVAGTVTLWVTFIPCFLWIFLAGPYLDTISARPRLADALSAITAAVVGVILNLAVWFAVHVLFKSVHASQFGKIPLPAPGSLDIVALLLTIVAGFLIVGLGIGIARALAIMAMVGLCLSPL